MSDNNHRQQAIPETSEELVPLAREYFSHEFPKSGQRCPSLGEIVELIESGKLPDDTLRAHLLTCSTCFVNYEDRLQKTRDMKPAVAPVRRHLSELTHYPWLRILVPSLPVLLIAAIAVIYFRPRPSNTQENLASVKQPVEVGNANANVVTTASPSPGRIAPSNNINPPTHVARVDLRNYSPQRGNVAGAEPPPLQIEQKLTTFTITLPERSPTGPYSVSIVDAFGKTIKARTSYSVDGKKLTATLSLDKLKNEKYRLCVSRSEEPPDCYPLVITGKGN
jgi:hypothetical protein